MDEFLGSNDWRWRLARTVAQGVVGVIVANVDLLVGACVMDPSARAVVAALARGEVGYVPPRGKYNKYAEALDLTDLYDFPKNGYDWCDIFYDKKVIASNGEDLA